MGHGLGVWHPIMQELAPKSDGESTGCAHWLPFGRVSLPPQRGGTEGPRLEEGW